MKFIIIPLIVVIVNDIIKYIFVYWRRQKILGNRFLWAFWWAGSFPSAHTALITSAAFLVVHSYGLDNAISAFAIFSTLIVIYNVLEQNKHEEIFESYIAKDSDKALLKLVKDKILLNFTGHTFPEVFVGVLEGIFITAWLLQFFP